MMLLVSTGLCFAASSACSKVAMQRGADVFRFGVAINVANLVFYPAYGLFLGTLSYDATSLFIGIGGGFSIAVGFALFLAALRHGPLAVAFTVFNLSIAVPVVMSIFVLGRKTNPVQLAGFLAALGAIVLLGIGKRRAAETPAPGAGRKFSLYMGLCFFFNGFFLFTFNLFKTYGRQDAANSFLWMVAVSGILFFAPVYLARRGKKKFAKSDILFPPFASFFACTGHTLIQLSMRHISDVVLFPIANGTALVAIVLVSIFFLKERANRFSLSGIAFAIAAVIMMSYNS